MESPLATPAEIATVEQLINNWLAIEHETNALVDAVERSDEKILRWFVRVRGEEKDVWTAWLTLGQRTLHFETYVMPAPEENEAEFYRHLLRRNHKLTGLAFEIGEEDALFLAGSLPIAAVTEAELDRILGSLWAAVELCFTPAVRLGFASRFAQS